MDAADKVRQCIVSRAIAVLFWPEVFQMVVCSACALSCCIDDVNLSEIVAALPINYFCF